MTQHAISRAKERYGLELTMDDIAAITRACVDGEALLVRDTDHGRIFAFRFAGQTIFPTLALDNALVTFQPRGYLKAGSCLSRIRGKTTPGIGRNPSREEYNRASWKREVSRAIREDA